MNGRGRTKTGPAGKTLKETGLWTRWVMEVGAFMTTMMILGTMLTGMILGTWDWYSYSNGHFHLRDLFGSFDSEFTTVVHFCESKGADSEVITHGQRCMFCSCDGEHSLTWIFTLCANFWPEHRWGHVHRIDWLLSFSWVPSVWQIF